MRRVGSSPTERLATPSSSFNTSWMTLRSDDVIGSSDRGDTGGSDLLGDLTRELDQRLLAPSAISGDVDAQPGLVIAEATLGGDTRQILHRIQRPPAGPDEQAELLADDVEFEFDAVHRDLRASPGDRTPWSGRP